MSDMTPITREEKLIAGEDLEPITRLEWFLKNYGGGGGGGTTVVANPTGAATDDLEKVQIGSTIYGIQGGASVYSGFEAPTSDLGEDGNLYAQYKAKSPYLDDFRIGYAQTGIFDTSLEIDNLPVCILNIKQYGMSGNTETLLYEYTDPIDFDNFSPPLYIRDDEDNPVCELYPSASTPATLIIEKPTGQTGYRLEISLYDEDSSPYSIQHLYLKNNGKWIRDDFDGLMPADEYIYSTAEQYVGKWINGVNTYQKTYVISEAFSGNKYITGLTNIENVIVVDGYFETNNNYYPLQMKDYNKWCFFDKASNKLTITSEQYSVNKAVVTIRYTKKQDGLDHDGENIVVDYNINEAKVGKWIDGSDLYQRTYVKTDSFIGDSSISAEEIQDFENVMLVDGYYDIGTAYLPLNTVVGSAGKTVTSIDKTGLILLTCNNWTASKVVVTIRYTKTV